MSTNDERDRETAENAGRNEPISPDCSLESAESYVARSPGTGAPGDGSSKAFSASFHALLEWGEARGLILEVARFPFLGRAPDAHGHEHEAWFDENESRWTKATYPNRFGCAWGRTETATAREYLTRLTLQNKYFGDDVQLLALVNTKGRLRVLTTQRHVAGTSAGAEEIRIWFCGLGFTRLNSGNSIAWYCDKRNLLISDAHEGNVIRTKDGILVPIDLNIIQPAGKWLDWALNETRSNPG
jgi:hypothetical protein